MKLSWNVMQASALALLFASAAQAEPKVIDSNGRVVGNVIGVMQTTRIVIVGLSLRGQLLPIDLLREAYLRGSLFFASEDCTGQPFHFPQASPLPVTSVANPGNTLYAESGPPQTVDFQSFIDASSGNCITTSFSEIAVPMAPIPDLDAEFTPPFSIRR